MLLAGFSGSKGPFEIPLLAAELSGLARPGETWDAAAR